MLQDIKKLDDIYELLKGNICDDPENYPGYILVKNDYDVCFRIFIYRELLQSTLTFYIDNSENPDNLIIYLRDLNNHYENNYKEFILDYNSDNNTYYNENNVYNIYDSTKNILDEIIRHYKIIKKDVPVESTRIEIGVSNIRYMIEHTLSQDYSEYGDNKYTDDGIQASNKYKDENLNLSTYSSISDFQNYIDSKNNTANQRFVNDLENVTIDEEFKQIIDEIFANYNIDKELYIRFSPHDEIEGVRETQVKLAIEKDGKIPQYEDDTEYYDSIVAKEKTPLFNRNLIYQNNKIDYVENENKLFNYFAFNITTGGTINFTGTGSNVLYYSRNNGTTWTEASSNISVSAGDKILWKGITTPGTTSFNYGIGTFGGDTDVRYTVGGNVMSLLFGDNFKDQTSLEGKDYAFYRLFNNNKNITSAENLSLPAMTLTSDCYNYMFYGCTNLTTAPSALPATILAERCYMSMFNDCTGLITVPELPATTLKFSCYSNMFGGCTNLTIAPELPATTLAPNCYYHMFKKCTNLTTAPELPATTLVGRCYMNMFGGCTSLTTAPELPATSLANSCYEQMFLGCTNLTTAPELPATILPQNCYRWMFKNCTNLITAPELPATTLSNSCYYEMFSGCTRLNSITCLTTNISATDCTKNWVDNVAATGTFIKDPSMTSWTTGNNGIPSSWTVKSDYSSKYFTMIVTTGGNITWTDIENNALSYSTDNGTTWSTASSNITLSVNAGDKVLWKGITTPYSTGIGSFSGDANVRYSVEGNIMSLLYGDDFKGQTSFNGKTFTFHRLFYQNKNITSAENLSLPVTTLTYGCYDQMFFGCTSLMTAPELPATTLVGSCYQQMFYGCTSLNSIKCLATDISETGCTTNWVTGVPPYEAEIEYLESTGTQWINTGIAPTTDMDCYLEFQLTSTPGTGEQSYICGSSQWGYYDTSYVLMNANASMQVFRYRINSNSYLNTNIPLDLNRHSIDINTQRAEYVFDNSIFSLFDEYKYDAHIPTLYLFSLHERNDNVVMATYPCKMRIFSFSLSRQGEKIFDIIPVRVSQVGYMYDKVSKQLFGNVGTGNFVLGNDVKVNTFIKDSSMKDWTRGNYGIPTGWRVESV